MSAVYGLILAGGSLDSAQSHGGKPVGAAEAKRLASLAVPPAYVDVLYAADPRALALALRGRMQGASQPEFETAN